MAKELGVLSEFSDIQEIEEKVKIEIAEQKEFFKVPRRFGNIPVEELPFGCDRAEQYRKLYPFVSLPFQTVERVSFGHPKLDPNRLFFGDNLHVMRLLPPESIDLIYIDPPFFSGRNYNVIFGDENEVRSFTDIWEGGMPGYLTWLNARLLEMKRLLKKTGSIYVHLDWHASHYVKVEMDKIFGYENLINEVVWSYRRWPSKSIAYQRFHDIILFYSKNKNDHTFNTAYQEIADITKKIHKGKKQKALVIDGHRWSKDSDEKSEFTPIGDDWYISTIAGNAKERIGYPTQKPEQLISRIIEVSSNKGDVVADFFCGGGTTPAVAQRLGRRWIACDQSKVAVAVTLDRLLKQVQGIPEEKQVQQALVELPDITVENWGVYEVPALVKLSDEEFKHFVIRAYNGRVATSEDIVHGYKDGIPLYVGPASQTKTITKNEVISFGETLLIKKGKKQGTMLAWAFAPSAKIAAEKLAVQGELAIDFVKINLIPIESPEFRKHITSKKEDYGKLLLFIMPPEIRVDVKRISSLTYEFDISESVSLNQGGKIINVQWDFDYKGRFVSTNGYSFLRDKNNIPLLSVRYEFSSKGKKTLACKVQDNQGGERTKSFDIEVT